MSTIAQNILLDLLHTSRPDISSRDIIGAMTATEMEQLLSAAVAQGVGPLFWHNLNRTDFDPTVFPEVSKRFAQLCESNLLRNTRHYQELWRLTTILAEENIPVILLKGIYLADTVYDNIGLREMSDIDLLVREADLPRITGILLNLGYTQERSASLDAAIQVLRHLPRFTNKQNVAMEIHWHITKKSEPQTIDAEALWNRSRPVTVAGCHARCLSPEDLLLHLCLHAAYQHNFTFGLKPLYDIAATTEKFRHVLDWQAIINRGIAWRMNKGLYLALRLAKELLAADVDAEVIRCLAPRDMDERIYRLAREHTCCSGHPEPFINPNLAEFAAAGHMWSKLSVLWDRIFLPKVVIAVLYSLPKNSRLIHFYYLKRLFDVTRRHIANIVKTYSGNREINNSLHRTHALSQWLK